MMHEGMPKRTVKDSVFCGLFGGKKYLLQLYNALHPEDTAAAEDDIRIVTIERALTDRMRGASPWIYPWGLDAPNKCLITS